MFIQSYKIALRYAFLLITHLAFTAGCLERSDDVRTIDLRVAVPADIECKPPSPISQVLVRAMGDFPATNITSEIVNSNPEAPRIERFPFETKIISLETSISAWHAGATALITSSALKQDVVLIPLRRSCVLPDPELFLRDGASTVATPNGGLLIAGGRDHDFASRRLIRLDPGNQLGTILTDELLLRREDASATLAGARVLIAGGGAGATGIAHDTFEIYDTTSATLEREASGNLRAPRRNHGAAALSDNRVLLVGGLIETGAPPLASAEIIDVSTGKSETDVGMMPSGKQRPHVLVLDDGTILVTGGSDESGNAISEILWFDLESKTFTPLDVVTPQESGSAVVLPGARMLWINGREPDEFVTHAVLLQRVPPYLPGAPSMIREDVPLPATVLSLRHTKVMALDDGSILITGENASGDAGAVVFDIGTSESRITDASRNPDKLLGLRDGTVAELNNEGISLRRELLNTIFDTPPATLLLGQTEGISFDLATHWSQRNESFVATKEDARIDVPNIVFSSFRLEFDARDGDSEILLLPEQSSPVGIRVRPDSVGPPLCTLDRTTSDPIEIERSGDSIIIRADGRSKQCKLDALTPFIKIAALASTGTALRSLRISRGID